MQINEFLDITLVIKQSFEEADDWIDMANSELKIKKDDIVTRIKKIGFKEKENLSRFFG